MISSFNLGLHFLDLGGGIGLRFLDLGGLRPSFFRFEGASIFVF